MSKGQETPVTAATQSQTRRKQVIRGIVVSDKMAKTRVVKIERAIRHGLYHKDLMKQTKIFVHDEKNESKVGDLISAESTRPLSKNKHFRMKSIIQKRAEQ